MVGAATRATPAATPGAFTASLWRAAISAYPLDGNGGRICAMDVVAVLLGILMFAILYALIFGIDRV